MVDVPLATPPDGVDVDAWLAACAAVRSYCGWHVGPSVTETVRVRAHGGVIVLPSLRVQSVASVAVKGTVLDATAWELTDLPTVWLASCPSVLIADVTMTHGFDPVPDDLLGALSEAASRGLTGSLISQVGQVRYSAGVAGISGAARFALDQVAVLDRYRLPPRP